MIQLNCPSNQQHPRVAMPKAICGNRPQDSKVSTRSHRKHNSLNSPGQVNTPPHLQLNWSFPISLDSTVLPRASSSLSTYQIPVLTPHALVGCAPWMPYQKTTARTILVLWSALGFPPKAIAALQITRISKALPRALDIWKSNKLNLQVFKMVLHRSETSELLF